MNERLLQYIWQFQHFNKGELRTYEDESLQVINPGRHNTNQGPDFLDAKLIIGKTTWAGSVELHINSSDWKLHNHDADGNYNNVILHVVWKHDVELRLPFPTLILAERVPKLLLEKFDELMHVPLFVPCEKHIHKVDNLTIRSMNDRMLVERLEGRSRVIEQFLQQNNNHWEETFWWLLARNFGAHINTEMFEKIARSLPVTILSKHKSQVIQLEALLFGQARLLESKFQESYPKMLKKEYRFLKNKYGLQQPAGALFFLRMRPFNFPTIRLAQLAMLIRENNRLFSTIKNSGSVDDIKKLLNVTANDYWHYHYTFDEPSGFRKKTMGQQMCNTILINAVIPVLFAYGLYHSEEAYKEKAIKWLTCLNAERNSITYGFTKLGLPNKNAFDSQAYIQLKHEYCDKKRCLECMIGNKILK